MKWLPGEYVHRPVGEEVRAIGGAYTLEKEIRCLCGGVQYEVEEDIRVRLQGDAFVGSKAP